ncbi:caspase family protein [Glycomyces salinus]|uniref:caspase family protein n=1 Tax=Glycomyces salinus TaxID=980294 RepID=UPI0018EDFB03|nr:caspase family protein [Glycomyces salinus]
MSSSRRRALLLACSQFHDPRFDPLPGARADVEELNGVLGDPEIGGFEVRYLTDVDKSSAERALESFFKDAGRDELLLLHLSLHGWKDEHNQLYFIVSDSDRDQPVATAISAGDLDSLICRSRAKSIVITLDCCYSGAFPFGGRTRSGATGTVDLSELGVGYGRALLTATTSLEYAYEEFSEFESDSGTAGPSPFSGAIVEGLRDGSADMNQDGEVSIQDLATFVQERFRTAGSKQTPTLSMQDCREPIRMARVPGQPDRHLEGAAVASESRPTASGKPDGKEVSPPRERETGRAAELDAGRPRESSDAGRPLVRVFGALTAAAKYTGIGLAISWSLILGAAPAAAFGILFEALVDAWHRPFNIDLAAMFIFESVFLAITMRVIFKLSSRQWKLYRRRHMAYLELGILGGLLWALVIVDEHLSVLALIGIWGTITFVRVGLIAYRHFGTKVVLTRIN